MPLDARLSGKGVIDQNFIFHIFLSLDAQWFLQVLESPRSVLGLVKSNTQAQQHGCRVTTLHDEQDQLYLHGILTGALRWVTRYFPHHSIHTKCPPNPDQALLSLKIWENYVHTCVLRIQPGLPPVPQNYTHGGEYVVGAFLCTSEQLGYTLQFWPSSPQIECFS